MEAQNSEMGGSAQRAEDGRRLRKQEGRDGVGGPQTPSGTQSEPAAM